MVGVHRRLDSILESVGVGLQVVVFSRPGYYVLLVGCPTRRDLRFTVALYIPVIPKFTKWFATNKCDLKRNPPIVNDNVDLPVLDQNEHLRKYW